MIYPFDVYFIIEAASGPVVNFDYASFCTVCFVVVYIISLLLTFVYIYYSSLCSCHRDGFRGIVR